ncbi:MAG: FIST C-terminal domain-containing protein [Elusimicrobia bacterium]|nr:FIST C-terminal domain-containing protein [Elusimicrobiota bacterium]
MRVEQRLWSPSSGWSAAPPGTLGAGAQVVLVFAAPGVLEARTPLDELRRDYPAAIVFGCSTAGEIHDTRVLDGSATATAVTFDRARVRVAAVSASEVADGREAGERLGAALADDGLVHVFALFDGLIFRGSDLARGLSSRLPPSVGVTGGLAGDGTRYRRTSVLVDGVPRVGAYAALGFYGPGLKVGHGAISGWDPFGPERVVTRSRGNVLYELDGKSALDLYRNYLGDHARDLPASGLIFPLMLRNPGKRDGVVRSVQAVDSGESSMTFSDYVPEGSHVQLMKGNFHRVVEGAGAAARAARRGLGGAPAQLAILNSCIARKMLLKQRTEEEIDGVRDALGEGAALTGFYTYGEIAPLEPETNCALYNHTMSVTVLSED